MRRAVSGRMVNVNERPASAAARPGRRADDPHFRLMKVVPRAVYRGEIYEIFVTDDTKAKPGARMRRFSLVGHFEVEKGGFVRAGDYVSVGGHEIGPIVGYNACPALRAPETVVIHVYVRGDKLVSGGDLGIKLDDEVLTRPVDPAAA